MKKQSLLQLKAKSILLFSFILISHLTFCRDVSYLRGMPRPEQVIKGISNSDPFVQYTKQIAALKVLSQIVSDMASSSQLTGEEINAANFYTNAGVNLTKDYESKYEKIYGTTKQSEWTSTIQSYVVDKTFRNEIIHKFLTTDAAAKVLLNNQAVVGNTNSTTINSNTNDESKLANWIGNGIFIFKLVFGILGFYVIYRVYKTLKGKFKNSQLISNQFTPKVDDTEFSQAGVRVIFAEKKIIIKDKSYDVNAVTGINWEKPFVIIKVEDLATPIHRIWFFANYGEPFVERLTIALGKAGGPEFYRY
jgi:hypothetical protein